MKKTPLNHGTRLLRCSKRLASTDINQDLMQKLELLNRSKRLGSANINQVRNDVRPFLKNPRDLDIWSNNYFLRLAGMMIMEGDETRQ